MKILYIPLDERPCNYKFPQLNADDLQNVEVITPPLDFLGHKREPANRIQLWNFIEKELPQVDYAVISLDMLLYGGLIPSRLHNKDEQEIETYFNKIYSLKTINEKCKIFGFQCIMRSPSYNSSEEEPEYYQKYGIALHRSSYLKDKKERIGLTIVEEEELAAYEIPEVVLKDYSSRVLFNRQYNIRSLELIKNGTLDFLVIPQDDSSPFGYTALSQKEVLSKIAQYGVEDQVRVYPGADEVGCSLVTRAFLEFNHSNLKIFPFFAATLGPQIIPLYEDRPMNESLKSHIEVCGLSWAETAQEADLILGYNCPGEKMEEAFEQYNKDVTYTSYRNLRSFVDRIENFIVLGKSVAICDSAFSNGGDLELFRYLERRQLLDSIRGYAGWNTNCNSLGTTLSALVFNHFKTREDSFKQVSYRLIEDVLYQSDIRQQVIQDYLPLYDMSYFVLNGKEQQVSDEIIRRLNGIIHEVSVFKEHSIELHNGNLPWKRMFELDFDMYFS